MNSLADAKPYQAMKVVAIHGARTFRRRLLEMGIVPGTEICVAHIAPLGCPIEFEARKTRLSVRRVEAKNIIVEMSAT
ncbi:MAG: ferrous iron transport protein A [Myxococcales bacterium]|nr:ferrous iron transport protein A [Myxococcales bacterium]